VRTHKEESPFVQECCGDHVVLANLMNNRKRKERAVGKACMGTRCNLVWILCSLRRQASLLRTEARVISWLLYGRKVIESTCPIPLFVFSCRSRIHLWYVFLVELEASRERIMWEETQAPRSSSWLSFQI